MKYVLVLAAQIIVAKCVPEQHKNRSPYYIFLSFLHRLTSICACWIFVITVGTFQNCTEFLTKLIVIYFFFFAMQALKCLQIAQVVQHFGRHFNQYVLL